MLQVIFLAKKTVQLASANWTVCSFYLSSFQYKISILTPVNRHKLILQYESIFPPSECVQYIA